MTSQGQRDGARGFGNPLVEALVGYGAFCTLGLVSRFVPAVFALFVAYGIVFPVSWAGRSLDSSGQARGWRALGFSRGNLGAALVWGCRGGSAWAIYTTLFFRRGGALPPLWGLQVAIAVPVRLLVMSPFQALFFRGWLQTRPEAVAGRWVGLGWVLWRCCSPCGISSPSWRGRRQRLCR